MIAGMSIPSILRLRTRTLQGMGIFCMVSTMAWAVPPAWSTPRWLVAAGGPFDTRQEHLGGLRLGLPAKDVPGSLACTPKKGREVREAASGSYVQSWKCPEQGVDLTMSAERKGGAQTIVAIRVSPPSTLATSRGIRIGSTEREVLAVYGKDRDQDGSQQGKQFVAGSVYDGLIFSLQDGKVVRIFLGAAAE